MAFGNAASCNNQHQAPCSLTITGSSPGCNIPCGSTQVYDGKTSFYLLSNANLHWVPTDATNLVNIPNAIKVLGPFNFMFGRILYNGNYILGKVQAGNGIYNFQTVTSNGQIQNTTGFEILTCSIANLCGKFLYIFWNISKFKFLQLVLTILQVRTWQLQLHQFLLPSHSLHNLQYLRVLKHLHQLYLQHQFLL